MNLRQSTRLGLTPVLVLVLALHLSLAWGAPEQLATAWSEKRYKDFLSLSMSMERQAPTVANAINVALGLYLTGKPSEALKKIVDVELDARATTKQKEKAATLRSDIQKYMDYKTTYDASRPIRLTGEVSMSKSTRLTQIYCRDCQNDSASAGAAGDTRASPSRSGRMLGLTAEEAETYLRQMSIRTNEAAGYDVSPRAKTGVQPENP